METRLSKTIYGNDIMNYFFVDDFAPKKKQKKTCYLRHFIIPNWHLLFQSQEWKHQNNVWNLFKVRNKDRRLWRQPSVFIFNFEMEQVNNSWAVKKLCRPIARAQSDKKKKCFMTFN